MMGKIHTHYDNLKVARLAPQEVIRAAYKALSQKYHPDKNPGNEKAARIMAILNGAYGALADPQRRKEHDEWIAAEEWEVEWLESTRQEERRSKHRPGMAQARAQDSAPTGFQAWRDWKWWCSLAACLGLGWLGGILMHGQSEVMPGMLASALGSVSDAKSGGKPDVRTAIRTEPKAEPKNEAMIDGWGGAKLPESVVQVPPYIKVMAVSQVTLAPVPDVCDSEAQMPLAPNGERWPLHSGPVEGFLIGNKGEDLQLTIDNGTNAWPVFIKLYEIDRHANVRYLFILPHDKLSVDQLAFGKYEVRYQKIDLGSSVKDGCGNSEKAIAK